MEEGEEEGERGDDKVEARLILSRRAVLKRSGAWTPPSIQQQYGGRSAAHVFLVAQAAVAVVVSASAATTDDDDDELWLAEGVLVNDGGLARVLFHCARMLGKQQRSGPGRAGPGWLVGGRSRAIISSPDAPPRPAPGPHRSAPQCTAANQRA